MDDLGYRDDDSAGGHSAAAATSPVMTLAEPDLRASGQIQSRDGKAEAVEGPRKRHRDGELRPPMGMVAGAFFGVASAVLYTLANIALRQCVGIDPFLVSAVKAAPTVLVLGPFLGWMLVRGEAVATSGRMVPRFIAAALIGQFVGNAAFQGALGMIGLAATVPITLGTMIIGAGVLGRVILHEPVRVRTAVAMVVLIASVIVLSLPDTQQSIGTESKQSLTSETGGTDRSILWLGSLLAAASGAAYALFGVMMRQSLTGGLSAPLTMFISGAVGTISLWTMTLFRLGPETLAFVPSNEWATMFAAGCLNFTAFVALSASLKSLPVVAVNLINASQVAMAAAAGIVLFAEPITSSLVLGIALTFVGLGILAGRRPPRGLNAS